MTPKGQKIFRKKALEQLSSPERLDELMPVTSSMGWLALLALGVVLAVLLTWSIYGRIPIRVEGQGLLMRGSAVLAVTAESSGRLKDIVVQPGDVLRPGDVVATLNQPELELQITHRRQELDAIAQQTAASDRNTAGIVSQLRQRRRDLEKKLTAEEQLVEQGLLARNVLLGSRSELANVDRDIVEQEGSLSGQANRLASVRRELDELLSRLETSSAVTSPYKGRVLELTADAGNLLSPGSRIVTLEAFDEPIDAVLYVPAANGKKVRPGMEARISPSTVKREEFGYIIGAVRSVSEYPVTPEGLQRVLRNQTLVSQLAASGAPLEITVTLQQDAATSSGFAWSSSSGPPGEIFSGTLCTGSMIVEKKRPISYVIPILKRSLGISEIS
jgi:HlyD family secretion protein